MSLVPVVPVGQDRCRYTRGNPNPNPMAITARSLPLLQPHRHAETSSPQVLRPHVLPEASLVCSLRAHVASEKNEQELRKTNCSCDSTCNKSRIRFCVTQFDEQHCAVTHFSGLESLPTTPGGPNLDDRDIPGPRSCLSCCFSSKGIVCRTWILRSPIRRRVKHGTHEGNARGSHCQWSKTGA